VTYFAQNSAQGLVGADNVDIHSETASAEFAVSEYAISE